MFLLSNAQRLFTLPELEQLGLLPCFDDIFLSSDRGCKKAGSGFFPRPSGAICPGTIRLPDGRQRSGLRRERRGRGGEHRLQSAGILLQFTKEAMALKAYLAYLFDLYGTLVDIHTDEGSSALWRQMSAWYALRGADYAPTELRRAYEAACREQEELLRRAGAVQYPEIDLAVVFASLYERRGIPADDRLTAETALAFRRASTTHLRLYAGAMELLNALRQAGRQVFLLSNAQRLVKPHTTKVACFLLPPCGGCPLEASDCLPTFTVFAQITHAAA